MHLFMNLGDNIHEDLRAFFKMSDIIFWVKIIYIDFNTVILLL
jgi:hypothetical protein